MNSYDLILIVTTHVAAYSAGIVTMYYLFLKPIARELEDIQATLRFMNEANKRLAELAKAQGAALNPESL